MEPCPEDAADTERQWPGRSVGASCTPSCPKLQPLLRPCLGESVSSARRATSLRRELELQCWGSAPPAPELRPALPGERCWGEGILEAPAGLREQVGRGRRHWVALWDAGEGASEAQLALLLPAAGVEQPCEEAEEGTRTCRAPLPAAGTNQVLLATLPQQLLRWDTPPAWQGKTGSAARLPRSTRVLPFQRGRPSSEAAELRTDGAPPRRLLPHDHTEAPSLSLRRAGVPPSAPAPRAGAVGSLLLRALPNECPRLAASLVRRLCATVPGPGQPAAAAAAP